MKAVVYERYGPPEVLEVREVAAPVPKASEVLVRVYATTVTAGDWRMRKADPFAARLYNGLLRPKKVTILGFEMAGIVEGIGKRVTRYKPGDHVFGHNGFHFGGYGEYVCLPEDGMLAVKSPSVSFEEAAALPIGGLAALNLLRKGKCGEGKKVLVYGASGSVGTFAVQIARHLGAEVTGVCSTTNLELVRSLGAHHVIDYTVEKVLSKPERYDLVFNAIGKMMSGLPMTTFKAILAPDGTFVSVEDKRKDRPEDLVYLDGLLAAETIRTVIDRRLTMEEIPAGHRYVEQGHKKGNVVVTI